MDVSKFKELIEQLREWGVIFDKGLTVAEIKAIESEGNIRFPEDLRAFLELALPIWEPKFEEHGPYIRESFPNWRTRGSLIIRMSQHWLLKGILSQVSNGYEYAGWENGPRGTWLDTWGQKPPTVEEAFAIVEKLFADAPILIPVYVHRFIPSDPGTADNPVFSVMETDIIHHGPNLVNYFLYEFGRRERHWTKVSPRTIRFWDDFL